MAEDGEETWGRAGPKMYALLAHAMELINADIGGKTTEHLDLLTQLSSYLRCMMIGHASAAFDATTISLK